MKRRLLLDVVVGQSAAFFELLTSEDEALLVRRDACTDRAVMHTRQRTQVVKEQEQIHTQHISDKGTDTHLPCPGSWP